MTTHTQTKDGYRWQLAVNAPQVGAYEGLTVYTAIVQQRQTTDAGRVYFRYIYPDAKFETVEARDRFLENFSARAWATGEGK